jgi:hypothetical protein
MSGRISIGFVDFAAFSLNFAVCSGRFWCETGAVTLGSRREA